MHHSSCSGDAFIGNATCSTTFCEPSRQSETWQVACDVSGCRWLSLVGVLLIALSPYDLVILWAGESQRLTDDGKLKFSPVFIRGGDEIIYSVHHQPKRVVLMRLKLSDGSRELVLPDGTASQFDPAYSRDGRFIGYARSGHSVQLSLVIVDTELEKEYAFDPPGTSRSTARTPRFTPDGQRVIFTLNGSRGQQIASVDWQGKDLRYLTESSDINAWPCLSPDGSRVVFSSSRNGAYNLYLMDLDGSNLVRLTRNSTSDMHATWSPQGDRIAFTSSRNGNYEIYVIDRDGENLQMVTDHPERDDFPAWHPDGNHLVTVAERKGRFDLYLIPVNTAVTK